MFFPHSLPQIFTDFTHFLKCKKYLLQFSHLQKELADQEPPSLLPKTFWDLLSSKLYPSGEFCPDCTTVSANRWLLYFPTVVLPKYLGSAQLFIASSSNICSKIFDKEKLLIIEDILRFTLITTKLKLSPRCH